MNQNRKIVIVTSEFPPGPGGIGDHAYNLSEQLVEKGYDVTVLSELRKEFDHQWKDTQYKARIQYVLRRKFLPNFNFIIAFVRLFFKYPDAIWIGTGSKSLMTLGLSISLFRRRTIAILHGHELLKGERFKSWLTQSTINNFSLAVAVSEFSKNNSKIVLSEQKISVIPNGFNHNKYNAGRIVARTGRGRTLNLLTVGRISARKGQHNVVKALPAIVKMYPQVVYHMVGIHDTDEDLKEMIYSLQLENNTRIHGVLSDAELVDLLKETDISIMLSQNMPDGDVEGFGIAIIEANFFGVPGIGSYGCGIEQAIQNGFNGRLVDLNEHAQIVEAITDILSSYPAYSANSIRWAQNHFWSNIIVRYQDVLGLLEERGGASGFFSTPENYLHKDFGVLVRKKFVHDLLGDISGLSVLDIGCGDGRVSLQFAGPNEVTLVDSSYSMIQRARLNTDEGIRNHVRYIISTLEEVQLPENGFDVIVAVGILAHLKSWTDGLSTLSHLLRKNGRIVVQISDASHWIIRRQLKPRGKRQYSLNLITRQALIKECSTLGMEYRKERRYGLIFRGMGLLPNKLLYHYSLATEKNRQLRKLSTEVIAVFEKTK